MALSKWYLCGSEGNFEKNEALAVTFAEKAAARNLPSAEFALGYYREVGINGIKDLEKAKRWYARVSSVLSSLNFFFSSRSLTSKIFPFCLYYDI